MPATHEVTNRVPPLVDHDPIAGDTALAEACLRHAVAHTLASLADLGRLAGGAQAQEWGRLANENPPRLRTHDRYGHRIDEVEFHPAWHELMRTAVENGLAGAPWVDGGRHAHVRRAVGYHGCPVTMTCAVVPALRRAPELAARYEPGLTARSYRFGLAEPSGKPGLVAGMGMTQKQGGSDVRANATRAAPRPDGSYPLTGHKWFTSAPMSDLFLVLARLDEGVSCVLVPRVLPDGSRNPFHVQRLEDKLGDRSNASSEVEFDGTTGWLVGEPGRGVPAIIEMVTMTRLDCVLGSAAAVRASLTQAVHHTRHREAFGARPVDQPLMRNVLADLAVESEAATALADRLAAAVDAGETAFLRLAGAAAKYRVCKRTPDVVAEAMEGLGQRHRAGRAGRWSAPGSRWQTSPRNWSRRGAPTGASTTRCRGCPPSWAIPRGCPSGPAGSPDGRPSACRARCCCGTPRPTSPTPSAPLAWAGTPTARWAPLPAGTSVAGIVDRAAVGVS